MAFCCCSEKKASECSLEVRMGRVQQQVLRLGDRNGVPGDPGAVALKQTMDVMWRELGLMRDMEREIKAIERSLNRSGLAAQSRQSRPL